MNRITAAILTVAGALGLAAGHAAAQDTQATLYHVTDSTYGCASPDATRALTNPSEPLRTDAPRFKTVFDGGRCVRITPRSPWKFVSQDGNDVALMSYAGTIGQPGSYYMKIDLLVDPLGHHPGEAPSAAAPQPPAANASQPAAGAPASDQSAPTALAPQSQQPTPPASTQSQSAPTAATTSPFAWAGWILLAVAAIILIAWRLARQLAGRRGHLTTYPLPLPDHVMADAARLADQNGATLDQFLVTVIAERVGQLKATSSPSLAAKQAGS